MIAICLYGSRVCGYAREDSDYDVLLILESYANRLRYNYRRLNGVYAAILAVDRQLIETDVKRGQLGDFVAGRLLSPYIPLKNPDYLQRLEVDVKRRVAEEEIRELIIEYGELARGLVVKPAYVALARMRKRARVYPPIAYSYANMLREDLRERNMGAILRGYECALENLAEEGIVALSGDSVTVRDPYVDCVLSKRALEKVVSVVELSRRALYSYVTHGRAGRISLEIMAKEVSSKLRRELRAMPSHSELEDPKNHLFLKTASGLVNLSERASIIEAVKKLSGGERVTISPLAGALNEVYMVKANAEPLVAKRFTDWFTFKWLYLNLAALGTRAFQLSGRERLANEYGTNRILAENNIPVPAILYVNPEDRLLIERYVEGKNILDHVRHAFNAERLSNEQRDVALDLGKAVARIHALNVSIGDCKPENFIRGIDGTIYTLDLEQGAKMGDTAWDVAEFLYFSGHYTRRVTAGIHQFVSEFMRGYCELGKAEVLKKAASLGYSKAFLVWTPMPVIRQISELLRKA